MKDSTDSIQYLMRTEKSTRLAVQRKYLFAVPMRATKPQIAQAVEELFKVKVAGVHTAIMPGKPKRMGARWGLRPKRKKAVVTLAEGQKIEVAA